MKQSEITQRLDLEDPICVMQIWSGRRGRLSDIDKLKGNWFRYDSVRKDGISYPVLLELPKNIQQQRKLRFYLWNLEIKAQVMWHRMVQLFKSFGKFTKKSRTAVITERQKTRDEKCSLSTAMTVP